nr:uncharacterized protein LOC109147017 [Ipomoea batatas]
MQQEVWDMLFAFRLLFLCVRKLLVEDVGDRISPWGGDEEPEALLEKLRELETYTHQNQKDVQLLFKKQNKMLTDLNKVLMWAKEQVHVLEMQVYHRKRNRQELQLTEQLFARYNLSGSSSSSSGPIHRQCGGKAPLLAIINVNQGSLNLEELLVFGGKLNKLRTLHLGRWNHCQGYIPRLKHNSVWVVVAKLKLLRTLKGVVLTQQDDADLISQITPHNLMKLSMIVNFSLSEVCNLQRFSNLHALKITWLLRGDVVYRYGFELPPQLKKLHLKSYSSYQNWPAWLKRHPTLETLSFSCAWEITAFPDNLMLPKLQVLILPDLSKFDEDIMEHEISRCFPSLKLMYAWCFNTYHHRI